MADDLIPRLLRTKVVDALQDTRVVVLLGARQCGKSTLVEAIADNEHPAGVVSLDDAASRALAIDDPVGFVAGLRTPVVIDEVHRAPDILLEIKRQVDRDQAPGRFLLTCSANLLTTSTVADALTGRAEYLRLWPLGQSEIEGSPASLIPTLFAGRLPRLDAQPTTIAAYAERIVAGGFPAARRRSPARRDAYFASYIDTVLQRDLGSIASVGDVGDVARTLRAIAADSAGQVVLDRIGTTLGISHPTIKSYVDLLETLFLVRRVPAWSDNRLTRVVRRPKTYVVDSGLLAHLLGADATRLSGDPGIRGSMLETFVAMEILRQADALDLPPRLHHYRDRDGREVDLVVERNDGSIVAIEVKATASPRGKDFSGLRYLRDRADDRFRSGILLYTGERTIAWGDRLAAVPVSALWSAGDDAPPWPSVRDR
ncbi:MAG: ATP-binding protein [Solirubrobacteraceae bacterium]